MYKTIRGAQTGLKKINEIIIRPIEQISVDIFSK